MREINLLEVPIIEPQEHPGWCGPASLNAAAAEQGVSKIAQSDLAATIGTDNLGTSHEMMENGAALLGLIAVWVSGLDFDELEYLRANGFSIIIDWMNGINANSTDDGHYSLLGNVTEDRVVLQDPEVIGSIKVLDKKVLTEKWFDFGRDGEKKIQPALVLKKKAPGFPGAS